MLRGLADRCHKGLPSVHLVHIAELASPYVPATQLAHTNCSSLGRAFHDDCSGKSTITVFSSIEVIVPTLEYDTLPQPFSGFTTDLFTWTTFPTCSAPPEHGPEFELDDDPELGADPGLGHIVYC